MDHLNKVYYYSKQTKCSTYFQIAGDFDPDTVSDMLNLQPDAFQKSGDKKSNGTKYDCAYCRFGTCNDYDVIVANQMLKTITPLLPKVDILREIKYKFDVDFTLEVVPTIQIDDTVPCIAPSLKIMQFCCDTETELDIDLYISIPDESTNKTIIEKN